MSKKVNEPKLADVQVRLTEKGKALAAVLKAQKIKKQKTGK